MIIFNEVGWKNFLSYGNAWTNINLNRSVCTLITGKNGSGKSTFMDALSFALFGKSFRNITTPSLINSINKKGMEVFVTFTIGSKEYRIERGLSPRYFKIYRDEELLNQESNARDDQNYLENMIIGFDHKSFAQIIVLGTSTFVPFMQLSPAFRRDVIEDFLDIRVFTSMATILKTYRADIIETISQKTLGIDATKNKIELQKNFIEALNKNKQDTVARIKNKKKEYELEKKSVLSKMDINEVAMGEWEQEKVSLTKKIKMFNRLANLKEKIKIRKERINEQVEFYNQTDKCPSCQQEIKATVKQNNIVLLQNDLDEIDNGLKEMKNKMAKYAGLKKESESLSDVYAGLHKNKLKEELELNHIKKAIKEQNDILKDMKSVENVSGGDAAKRLLELEDELAIQETELEKAKRDKGLYELATLLLKDTGIKTDIVSQYIPVINGLIKKYLAKMDFFVLFELDDKFNEVIRSRHRDKFVYESFSEGEKKRIDLALLFTWRAIAKMKNSVSTNLLILDEVFDGSLDANGVEEMIKIIKSLAKDQNCFIISHAETMQDKFDNVLSFKKTRNFSKVENISAAA